MNRESFLETVRTQYAEKIHEAYLQCEHENGRQIDYPKLSQLLWKLMKNAKVDGLAPSDFQDLIKSTLPQVSGNVDFATWKTVA